MNSRRGFFAFIGNAAVTGLVSTRASAAKPTLILPPSGITEPAALLTEGYPLLAQHKNQMIAVIAVKQHLPDPLFLDWLEGGLRMARGFQPGGHLRQIMLEEIAAGRDPWGTA